MSLSPDWVKRLQKLHIMDRGWYKDRNQYLMEPWSEECFFLWSISQNIVAFRRSPKIGSKTIERWKSIGKGNLRWIIPFWNNYLKIFDFPCWRHQPKNWVKKIQIDISCSSVGRKMRIESKRYFKVNCFLMKPFSQHFLEILTQRCHVINSNLARKRV